MPESLTTLDWAAAQGKILDGDVLLFRHGFRLRDLLIARAGRSEYDHAAVAGWWGVDLMCLETVQLKGGRAVLLEARVKQFHGRIDVYRADVRGEPRRRRLVRAMKSVTGKAYGWWNLILTALTFTPVLRLLFRAKTDDKLNGSLPYCSQAVAKAYREEWHDLVPNCADKFTSPGDLARSALLTYQFTIGGVAE